MVCKLQCQLLRSKACFWCGSGKPVLDRDWSKQLYVWEWHRWIICLWHIDKYYVLVDCGWFRGISGFVSSFKKTVRDKVQSNETVFFLALLLLWDSGEFIYTYCFNLVSHLHLVLGGKSVFKRGFCGSKKRKIAQISSHNSDTHGAAFYNKPSHSFLQ